MENSQKLFTNIALVVVIIAVIGIAGYSAWSKKSIKIKEILPDSFIMTLHRDSSSSGANRNYEAVLSFVDNNLVYGRATYHTSSSGGEINSLCLYKNSNWVDAESGKKCGEYLYSITKEKLENDIKSGEIKLADEESCMHGALCYQLTDNEELLVNYLEPKAENTSNLGDYSFKAVAKSDPNIKGVNVFVEIYKNEKFIKSVEVGEASIVARMFVLSPDKKNVVFKVTYQGGPCVSFDNLKAINLDTFSLVAFGNNAKLEDDNPGYAETIENIKWISNNEVEAVVRLGLKYGDEWDCGPGTSAPYIFKLIK